MDPMLEDLARATVADRLAAAEGVRRGRRGRRGRRAAAAGRTAGHKARRARDAVRRASLALARAE